MPPRRADNQDGQLAPGVAQAFNVAGLLLVGVVVSETPECDAAQICLVGSAVVALVCIVFLCVASVLSLCSEDGTGPGNCSNGNNQGLVKYGFIYFYLLIGVGAITLLIAQLVIYTTA